MSADQPGLHALLGVQSLPDNLQDGVIADSFEQALAHLQQGHLAEARALCEQILAIRQQVPEVLHLQALIAMQEKNFTQAIALFSQVVQLQPGNLSVYFNLGQVFLLTRQYVLAEKTFVYVLQIAPDIAVAQLGLGQALGYQGQYMRALQHLESAIVQIEKLSASDAGLAWMHKGMAQGALANHREAVRSFRQAISYNPQLAQAYFCLGNALYLLGYRDAAEKSLKKTIKLDDNFAPAYFLLGLKSSELQQYDQALKYFNRVIELTPKMAEAKIARDHVLQAMDNPRAD